MVIEFGFNLILSPVWRSWLLDVIVKTPVVAVYPAFDAVISRGESNPWLLLVRTISPVAGLYVAPVGVKFTADG